MSGGKSDNEDSEQRPGRARWVILLLTCGGLFGQFYAFDIPSAVNLQLGDHLIRRTGIDEAQYIYYFNLLYSVYSMPNAILPLIMGVAMDRCGYRILIVFLAFCVVAGQLLFAAGVWSASWTIMLAGRILFGIGGESVQVAQTCLLFRWFKGREVAFALGLNLSVARTGSVLNDVVSPWASQRWGVMGSLWVGVGLCAMSFACNALVAILDKSEGEKAHLAEANGEDEKVTFRDLFKLPRLYWLLTAQCVILYCCILPFNNIASAFFIETFYPHLPLADAQQLAGQAMAMLFMSSALGTPPFGILVDIFGMRSKFILFSSVLLTVSYTTIFTVSPFLSMACLGVVYMVFSGAIWPAFALTVSQKELGSAYGIATALQNTGLAIMPLLIGSLQAGSTHGGHFVNVIRLFILLGGFGVVVAALTCHVNAATRGVLELPSGEADRIAKEGEKIPLHCEKAIKQLP